jgi:hypothetical protein
MLLPFVTISIRWRTMFGIAVVPSILLAIGMAFSPESPRWLFQVSVCKFFDHSIYSGPPRCDTKLKIYFSDINCSKERLSKQNQL